ncbi:MAG TPA: hypothetical protein VNB49_10540 [Candidatus Dormibacteraeota bacterium]|nr:hypothetical protein [Candidatus Dormibacteraeota bacterium]
MVNQDEKPDAATSDVENENAELRKRIEALEKALTSTAARVPQLVVPAHGGGPGNDQHQAAWSKAEQEWAQAHPGELLDHWVVDDR